MDMALALADRDGFEKRRAEARRHGKLRGLGIANPIEVAGGPYTAMNPDTASLRVNADGSVSLFTGSTSMGRETRRPSPRSWPIGSACRPSASSVLG